MRILRLTTSNDTVHQGPGSRVDWLKRLGEEQLGEPVDIISRPVWPDSRLPAAAEKWIEREQPDIVWLVLQSFWFEYLSVPKRLERKFGRAGKVASEAGFKAADKPLIANNFVFRQGRRLLQRTLGGDPHFDRRTSQRDVARQRERDHHDPPPPPRGIGCRAHRGGSLPSTSQPCQGSQRVG